MEPEEAIWILERRLEQVLAEDPDVPHFEPLHSARVAVLELALARIRRILDYENSRYPARYL